MTNIEKVRVAVVGLNLGKTHAQAYAQAKDAELRWVVDLNEEAARQTAEQLGCGWSTDWTAILGDVDAVSLCTPHHLHAPQTLQAIAAGKHVLLEKPLANSKSECETLIHAAAKENTVLMLAYVVRYLPALRKLKEVIDSGQYGKPISVNCWMEAFLPPAPGTWFASKEKLGGGVLFSHGCHYIDILIWLFGEPIRATAMGTRIGTEWMEGEGTAHALMTFENGALGHLVASWGMPTRKPPAKLHIHTTEGLIVLDSRMTKLEFVTKDNRIVLFEAGEAEKNLLRVSYEIEHFLQCIRTGQRPETDGTEALKSHLAIWDMYRQMDAEGEMEKEVIHRD